MASLRRRIYGATGWLIALQVVGTGLGFASWMQVHHACATQQEIAAAQESVLGLAHASREVYVHQAHTLIERGAGHLDHLAEVTADVDARVVAAEGVVGTGADLGPVREALAASHRWFATDVVPVAQAGLLDEAGALRLHDEAERHATMVDSRLGEVLSALDAAQTREREAVAAATARAWGSVAFLTLTGAALGIVVARGLARGVLEPIGALRGAAAAFGGGRPAVAPERGDDELSELGRAFNRMVDQVQSSERRRLEVERLAALGEMSGAIAHELLNPLTVVLGEPAMRRPELAEARAEAEHARRIVAGLLGFARPGEEPPEEVDLAAAAAQAVDRITPAAELKEVDVRLASVAPASLYASPSAVRQVLDNLIRNAVEASEPGMCVEVELRPGPVVEVRDRGPGIPATIRPRLYEPFVTGRPEGTGLGLAICQRIVRAQGGTLAHLDRTEGGTVARWTLAGVGHV